TTTGLILIRGSRKFTRLPILFFHSEAPRGHTSNSNNSHKKIILAGSLQTGPGDMTSLRMPKPRLSQELIDLTLEFLTDDQEALRQCCLVSRSFQIPVQKILFGCVRLKPVPPVKPRDLENQPVDSAAVATTSMLPQQINRTLTMAQRLSNVLNSSPHLAGFIKDLRIWDRHNFSPDHPTDSWLKDDTTLPRILPLLTNLQRFFLAGSTSGSMLDIATLPEEMKTALFEVWRRSSKITHVGLQCITFSSFPELVQVLKSCERVKHVTLITPDVDDVLDGLSLENVEADVTAADGPNAENAEASSPSDTSTKETIYSIESLGLFLEPELLCRLCAWLLEPSCKLRLSLQKLSLVTEPKDLKLVGQVVQTSTSLEEMRITLISDDETSQTEPFNISTLRVVHLCIDFDVSAPHHPDSDSSTTLNWWCDTLTSSSSNLSLQDFNIYILTEYHQIPSIKYDQPGWNRLDETLSAEKLSSVTLRVHVKCLEDDDVFEGGWSSSLDVNRYGSNRKVVALEELEKFGKVFPRMRDRGRLVVSQMKGFTIGSACNRTQYLTTSLSSSPSTTRTARSVFALSHSGHSTSKGSASPLSFRNTDRSSFSFLTIGTSEKFNQRISEEARADVVSSLGGRLAEMDMEVSDGQVKEERKNAIRRRGVTSLGDDSTSILFPDANLKCAPTRFGQERTNPSASISQENLRQLGWQFVVTRAIKVNLKALQRAQFSCQDPIEQQRGGPAGEAHRGI
ncbi:hypothetical protein L218DRAFT_1063162, partial [Marasmius fiardii PR-910]